MTWVKLKKVGCVSIETRLSTITKYPNSYLVSIFQSDQIHNCDGAQDGVFMLYCDPACFTVVLSGLRYGELSLPVGLDYRLLGLTARRHAWTAQANKPSGKETGEDEYRWEGSHD